jgi:hypothetical protein
MFGLLFLQALVEVERPGLRGMNALSSLKTKYERFSQCEKFLKNKYNMFSKVYRMLLRDHTITNPREICQNILPEDISSHTS